jgi:four helix bundle protein
MTFPHESLLVYQWALGCFAEMQPMVLFWGNQHAFVDHLARALESILFNLVEAARLQQGRRKTRTMDYALGSVYECAACLDIAGLKGLVGNDTTSGMKARLLEVCKMLIGLRKSWMAPRVAEDAGVYEARGSKPADAVIFFHETLDSYRVALDVCRWLYTTESGRNLETKSARAADQLATCIVLQIAEGSGRFSALSRDTFLDRANAAAAKLAALLDMGAQRGVWSAQEAQAGKELLVRIGQMTGVRRHTNA